MSETGTIRNIIQTVQEREVIKQAPDLILYIDGEDYLINPYLGDSGTAIAFNNYLISFQTSYDVENLIPTASVTLAVPNHLDFQFRSPGGNNILKTMSELKVFCKGYYLSPRGNSMYYQCFRGFISNISYNPDGKMTMISISAFGALGILDRMQVDMAPSAMSSASLEVTPLASTTHNLNPYQMLAWTFVYSSMIDGFEQASIQQAQLNDSNYWYQAIQNNYVIKWEALLFDLARDVHIFPLPNVDNVINEISENVKSSDVKSQPYNKDFFATARDKFGKFTESQDASENADLYQQITGFHPDHRIGNIQLLNGQVMSRLARIRLLCDLIGYEGYQDVDGGVVFKPPLYNLDVTNVNGATSQISDGAITSLPTTTVSDTNSIVNLYTTNNPFVVMESEIISDPETEDEGQVRLTRILMRGQIATGSGIQFAGNNELVTTAEYMDVAKMQQFGLRTEPPRIAPWFKDSDQAGLYAYGVSELVRANRGFRTISITIPARPEIKLGFPMYIPHRDIYGYIKNVSLNYTQGGDATMTILLDNIRRRPLYAAQQQVQSTATSSATSATNPSTSVTMLTPQTNLILQWTKGADASSSGSSSTSGTATTGTSNAGTPSVSSTSPAGATSLPGSTMSLPIFQQEVFDQQRQMLNYRTKQIGNSLGTENDTVSAMWRIQVDTDQTFGYTDPTKGEMPRLLNSQYFKDLRTKMPFTDSKGYELVGPFPYGRGFSLQAAVQMFTVNSAISSQENPAITPRNSDVTQLSNSAAFLFTGVAAPGTSPSAASDLISALQAQDTNSLVSSKVFELTYTSTGQASTTNGLQSASGASTADAAGQQSVEELEATKAAVFLTGSVQPTSQTLAILRSVTPPGTTDD
jgi:hypothetical protein